MSPQGPQSMVPANSHFLRGGLSAGLCPSFAPDTADKPTVWADNDVQILQMECQSTWLSRRPQARAPVSYRHSAARRQNGWKGPLMTIGQHTERFMRIGRRPRARRQCPRVHTKMWMTSNTVPHNTHTSLAWSPSLARNDCAFR